MTARSLPDYRRRPGLGRAKALEALHRAGRVRWTRHVTAYVRDIDRHPRANRDDRAPVSSTVFSGRGY